MGDIANDLRITNTDLLCVVPSHQLNKQLLQRMRFGIMFDPQFVPYFVLTFHVL